MNSFELLIRRFDFRKGKNICNNPGCYKKPERVFLIEEDNLRLHKKKDLAEIKLCPDHVKTIKPALRELNEKIAGDFRIIRFREKKI
jgi:hypothetical protein